MENINNETQVVDSGLLTEQQELNINNGRPVNEGIDSGVVLPSEVNKDYEIPEKYAGKSAEEVYRLMKIEEEYNKNKSNNGKEGDVPNEDVSVTENDGKIELTETETVSITQKVIENNGVVTDEIYAELQSKGYSKEDVDNIKAGLEAKAQAQVNEVFASVGTNVQDYQAAGEVLINSDIWTEQEIADYRESMDKAIKAGDIATQRNNIRMVMNAVKGMPNSNSGKVHSNTPTVTKRLQGYASRAEYAADLEAIRYSKDKSLRAIVEKKFELSDTSTWR